MGNRDPNLPFVGRSRDYNKPPKRKAVGEGIVRTMRII